MIIYKITNLINGKIYIGQTIHSAEYRFTEHCRHSGRSVSAIADAILKYGKENFALEQIDQAETIDALNLLESYWISLLNTISPNGYNLREGGGSKGKHCQESKDKMSAVQKKIGISPEQRKKMNDGRIGSIRPPHSEETKRKISQAHIGIKHTDETKIKMKESMKTRGPVTDETKAKLKELMANRGPKTSKYKGVYLDKKYKKWISIITVDGKRIELGRFDNEDDAGEAYNSAVLKYRKNKKSQRLEQ